MRSSTTISDFTTHINHYIIEFVTTAMNFCEFRTMKFYKHWLLYSVIDLLNEINNAHNCHINSNEIVYKETNRSSWLRNNINDINASMGEACNGCHTE